MMRRRLLIPVVAGLVLAGCQDQGPDALRQVIPAQHALVQVSGFSFLTPLSPNKTTSGVFNPNLFPFVEICVLNATKTACGAAPFATFSRTAGSKNELIFVVSGSHYGLDWKTDEFGIPNGTYARITARSAPGGGRVFGYVDIFMDTNGNALKAAATAGFVGVKNGSSLPIKFRLENGVFCDNDTECFEGTLDSNGGTFTLPDGTAGVQAPAGAVNQGESGTLVIERYRGPDPCLPTDYPQYEACLRIKVEGNITTLNTLVDVGFCVDAAAESIKDELEVAKWDEVNPGSLTVLPPADVSDFITCGSFAQAPSKEGAWSRLASVARALTRPVASLLGAKPLYAAAPSDFAGPFPFGAGMSDFSRVGVQRPLTITKVSGDNQTTFIETPVTPTVKITSTRTGAAASGVTISFTQVSGSGFANPTSALTDGLGLASTSWTLGAGANQLRADANNPRAFWPGRTPPSIFGHVVFNGTGVDISTFKTHLLPPIGASGSTTNYVGGLSASVEICLLDAQSICGPVLFTVPAIDDGLKYQGNWNTPSDLVIGGTYRLTVRVGTFLFTNYAIDIQPLTGGKAKNLTEGTEFNFQVGSTLPLKFVIESQ